MRWKDNMFIRDNTFKLISLTEFGIINDIQCLKKRIPVIGQDLLVQKSCLISGENGLFAQRNFKKNEIITFYDGKIVDYQHPSTVPLSLFTHTRSLIPFRFIILGNVEKNSNQPFRSRINSHQTMGGGAFINYSRKYANCEFCHIDSMLNESTLKELDPHQRLICIVALRDIQFNEELLIDYGLMYWRHVNQKSQQMK